MKLLTLKAAAEAMSVSKRTVRRWIDSGQLQAVKLGDRCVRVRERDLETFIDSGGSACNSQGRENTHIVDALRSEGMGDWA